MLEIPQKVRQATAIVSIALSGIGISLPNQAEAHEDLNVEGVVLSIDRPPSELDTVTFPVAERPAFEVFAQRVNDNVQELLETSTDSDLFTLNVIKTMKRHSVVLDASDRKELLGLLHQASRLLRSGGLEFNDVSDQMLELFNRQGYWVNTESATYGGEFLIPITRTEVFESVPGEIEHFLEVSRPVQLSVLHINSEEFAPLGASSLNFAVVNQAGIDKFFDDYKTKMAGTALDSSFTREEITRAVTVNELTHKILNGTENTLSLEEEEFLSDAASLQTSSTPELLRIVTNVLLQAERADDSEILFYVNTQYAMSDELMINILGEMEADGGLSFAPLIKEYLEERDRLVEIAENSPFDPMLNEALDGELQAAIVKASAEIVLQLSPEQTARIVESFRLQAKEIVDYVSICFPEK